MQRLKTSMIILIMACIVFAGCVSSSGDNPTPSQKVVATVGAPTPTPTEPPEPTIGPTWTPTPTPVPMPVTLSDFVLQVRINADQRQWTGDPSESQQINAQYAARQDLATFVITNTGTATLKNLVIVYDLAIPMTTTYNGQDFTTINHQSVNSTLDTLKPGEYREVTVQSPIYGAMLTADMTITAYWAGGSLELYKAELEPKFDSGTSYTPSNGVDIKQYGSAYN